MHPIPQRSTLVHQVRDILRDGIRNGLWREYLPGELELSRKLQVSRMTLRAALETLTREGWLSSSQGRRRRVLENKARRRAAPANQRIMLLTAVPIEGMGSLHMLQVDGLREQLAKAGFELEVHSGSALFSQNPGAALERLGREKPASAWVLQNSSAPLQRWFMERKLPCLVIGARHPGMKLPSVGTDYVALGRHAAGQFLRRRHRQLVVLIPADDKAGHINTVTGFSAACGEVAGAEMRVIRHDGSAAGVRHCLETMLKESRPTGLLVALPQFVLTAMSAFTNLGVRVPQDISIISRDGDWYLDYMVPPIARYVVDVPLFVQKITRTVLVIAGGGIAPARDKLLLPEFVPGETLGYGPAKTSVPVESPAPARS